MADQLDQLVGFAELPRIYRRMIPLPKGGVLGSGGHFEVVDLIDEDFADAVLYLESFTRDSLSHDPKEVAFLRGMFETAWLNSLDEGKTIRAIAAEAAALRARIDRT